MWIDPLRLRAAQKEAKSKTAFARMLLMFFYKKEELKGKRLHELDQDIVHAIIAGNGTFCTSSISIHRSKQCSSILTFPSPTASTRPPHFGGRNNCKLGPPLF